MTRRSTGSGDRLDHPEALRLDAALRPVRAAWKRGDRPRIEDCLMRRRGTERPTCSASCSRSSGEPPPRRWGGPGSGRVPPAVPRRSAVVDEAFADDRSSAGEWSGHGHDPDGPQRSRRRRCSARRQTVTGGSRTAAGAAPADAPARRP